MNLLLRAAPLALALTLAGCGVAGRLAHVGRPPTLDRADDMPAPPTARSLGSSGARGRSADGANPAGAPPARSASLFRVGAGSFLGDQRASGVGDILTVRINISDKAEVGNSTSRSRTGSETAGIANLLGFQTSLAKVLPGTVDPAKLVDTNTKSSSDGTGTTKRSETINMTVAAVVTGVLPNGNLLIKGRQEVRVNFELRELIVTGIVRPQDIARDNSILHSQIAEARISYGGRGQLTDAQQARWGQQIYDALFPF